MIRAALVALLLAYASSAWARTTDVAFVTSPSSSAVGQAVQAIREGTQMGNVPLSAISAALVDLNGDRRPELFVQLGGSFCGSLGCATMLFEQGTTGWIKIGDWLVSTVSVTDAQDVGWRRLLLNHEHTWRHGSLSYDLMQ